MKLHNLNRLLLKEFQLKTTSFQYLNNNKSIIKSRYFSNLIDNKINKNDLIETIDPLMVNRKFFIDEPNAANHLPKHQGMFYTIPKEINNTLFAVYGWTDRQKLIFETFDEGKYILFSKYIFNLYFFVSFQ